MGSGELGLLRLYSVWITLFLLGVFGLGLRGLSCEGLEEFLRVFIIDCSSWRGSWGTVGAGSYSALSFRDPAHRLAHRPSIKNTTASVITPALKLISIQQRASYGTSGTLCPNALTPYESLKRR